MSRAQQELEGLASEEQQALLDYISLLRSELTRSCHCHSPFAGYQGLPAPYPTGRSQRTCWRDVPHSRGAGPPPAGQHNPPPRGAASPLPAGLGVPLGNIFPKRLPIKSHPIKSNGIALVCHCSQSSRQHSYPLKGVHTDVLPGVLLNTSLLQPVSFPVEPLGLLHLVVVFTNKQNR